MSAHSTFSDPNALGLDEVRALARALIERVAQDSLRIQTDAQLIARNEAELKLRKLKIEALTHEIALLKHWRFAAKTEVMDAVQGRLFAEANAEDLAAAEQRLAELTAPSPAPAAPPKRPARKALPAQLPRIEIRHEPEHTDCGCGQAMQRVSEDVSERLDYVPGTFRVERHIRGVWACRCCACVKQVPVPAHIIDGGIPTAGLLAQVLIAKYDDHLPLYRQSEIYAREGVELGVSTLADWVGHCGARLAPLAQALTAQLLQVRVLHADESPLSMLNAKGGKQRAYIWAYVSGAHEAVQAVIYEVKTSRSGQHVRDFLQHEPQRPEPGERAQSPPRWSGHLVVDDYGGYKALFDTAGDKASNERIVEVGCWAHVRRKFFELHVANKSALAHTMLQRIGQLYDVERAIREQGLDIPAATALRQAQARPLLQALHEWLRAEREQLTEGTAAAKAVDYTLRRWSALVRYAEDGALAIDNNRVENKIRPWAVGRKNWLFAGSPQAGERAAGIMSLIESAKMNGLDPHAYLRDVLERLPTHPNSRIDELLPTRWKPIKPS